MQRLFSIAILLNWFAVILFVGAIGFGFGSSAQGLLSASADMIAAHPSGAITAEMAQSIVVFIALIVLTAALWAVMTAAFVRNDGSEAEDEDFVIVISLAICLGIFALLMGGAIWFQNPSVGALASVASFATLLAGIAHRICIIEVEMRAKSAPETSQSFSAARATSMANQSALLATVGARSSRFVPKRPYQP